MKHLVLSIVLLLVATGISSILFPLGVLFVLIQIIKNIIQFNLKTALTQFIGYLANLLFGIALLLDVFGNILCRDLFNAWFIRDDYPYPFGDWRDTISRVLGVNKQLNNLTWSGATLSRLLNFLDTDHVERAAQAPILRH